jgi:hypothetical protein
MSKKLIQQHTKQVFNRMNTADKPIVPANSVPIQSSSNPLTIAKQVLRSKQEAAIKLEQQQIAKEQEALRVLKETAAKQCETLRIEQEQIVKEKEILRLKAIEEEAIRLKEEQTFKFEQECILKEKELLKMAKEKAIEEQEVFKIEHEKIAREYETLRIEQEELVKEKEATIVFEEDLRKEREAIIIEDYERKITLIKDVSQEEDVVQDNFSPRTETTASIEGIEDNIEFNNQVEVNQEILLSQEPIAQVQELDLVEQVLTPILTPRANQFPIEDINALLSGDEDDFVHVDQV